MKKTRFKRAASVLLVLCLLMSCVPAYAAKLPKAPNFTVVFNQLLLDGSPIDVFDLVRSYDMRVIAREDLYNLDLESLALDVDLLDVALEITVDPQNVVSGSVVGMRCVTLALGDSLLFRKKASSGTLASTWKQLIIDESMMAQKAAVATDELPDIETDANSFTIKPENIYTEYEYAITKGSELDARMVWTNIGSCYSVGKEDITVALEPTSFERTIFVRVAGDKADGFLYKSVAGVTVSEPQIWFDTEMLGPLTGGTEGDVWYLNTKGGKKWTTYSLAPGEEMFVSLDKVFGKKEVTIQLKKGEGDLTAAEIEGMVLNVKCKPRPDFPKGAAIKTFVSNAYPENWTLTGTGKSQIEYRVDTSEPWSFFDSLVGLPLLSAEDQVNKVKQTPYIMRVMPNEATMTPGSKVKKFSQPKQTKAPTFKLDYKTETIKTKGGAAYYVSSKPMTDFTGVEFTRAGDTINAADIITNSSYLYIYLTENGKKSRSAFQTIVPAPRYSTPDDGEAISFDSDKGKVKLMSGFEAKSKDSKWGGLPKGVTAVSLRRKPDAKFNSKTGESTGYAASLPVAATISYSEDKKTVTAVSMPKKSKIQLANLSLYAAENCSVRMGENYYYSSFYTKEVFDYSVSITELFDSNWKKKTCGFSLIPSFLEENGSFNVEEAVVTVNGSGKEIVPEDGLYELKNLRLGDVVTLELTPVDTNTYKKTTYTLTIVEPPLPAPAKIVAEQYSNTIVTDVTLAKALTPGDYIKLKVWVSVQIRGVDVEVSSRTVDINYDAVNPFNNVYVRVLFDDALNKYGTTLYKINAQAIGVKGESADSSVTSLESRVFTLYLIDASVPPTPDGSLTGGL